MKILITGIGGTIGSVIADALSKQHEVTGIDIRSLERNGTVVADLTDERPSCYFEAGYAEASVKPVVYVASKESIIKPGTKTKIPFDIHMNVNFFTNHDELREKLAAAVKENQDYLFAEEDY